MLPLRLSFVPWKNEKQLRCKVERIIDMFRLHLVCLGLLTASILAGSHQPAAAASQQKTVTIEAGKTGEPISKYIYGQFIEHLGRCIYGGIWAEMLEDRKFYFPITPQYDPYRASRGVAKDALLPVVGASPWQITAAPDSVTMVKKDSFVGEHTPLIQPGSGIRQLDLGLVKNKKYVGYIYLKPQQLSTTVMISLHWGDKPEEQKDTQLLVVANNYSRHTLEFTAGADTLKGKLEIKVAEAAMGPCFIGTVSLMPADNINGMRRDTLGLLKELNAPIYRWPGGNFVSGYDWRDGIGDRDRRPPRQNPAWTGVEHNDFGLDELIAFCREVGAEPLITVNTGLGDAYSAAQEVEYANGSVDTIGGRWRAQNGNPEPYNVEWWCIGNEMYGRWQLGYMQLRHYTLKHNQVAEYMRKVDPKIKLIAVGALDFLDEGTPNEKRGWSRGMLEQCAEKIDLISEHFYCREELTDISKHIAQITDRIKEKAEGHRKLRKELPVLEGRDIRIAMDEWNYWYRPYVYGELGCIYRLRDGLGIAAGIHEYARNSDIITMAHYAQTVNVIGCIKTTKTAAAFETTGLALKLYRNNFGTLPVAVTGDAEPLDVAAAWTTDRKALTIGIVNPTEQEHELAIDLKDAQLTGKGRLWLIADTDPLAYNEPGKEPNVEIEEKPVTGISNKLNLPPLSISLYKLVTRN